MRPNIFPRFLLSYPLHRATVAGLSFIAVIIGARYLPFENFSSAMSAAFLVKFLQILNFGATSGYFVSRYAKEGTLGEGVAGTEQRFLIFFGIQLISFGLAFAIVSFIWLPQYFFGAIAFLLVAPCFAVEPYVRYRRNFSFSLVPDLLLNAGLFSLIALQGLGWANMMTYLLVVGILSVIFWVTTMLRHIPSCASVRFGGGDYLQVLALGWPLYLGSALFLLASSMDRLLLSLYGEETQISLYFLAHQLSVGSMIFVTAINFVNTVNLGEARQERDKIEPMMVYEKLKSAALVATASYFSLISGTFILESTFLPTTFHGLSSIVIVQGAGFAAFFTSNSITPLVAYFRHQMPLTLYMGLVVLALFLNNLWIYMSGMSVLFLATGTTIIFSIYSIFAITYTFYILKKHT